MQEWKAITNHKQQMCKSLRNYNVDHASFATWYSFDDSFLNCFSQTFDTYWSNQNPQCFEDRVVHLGSHQQLKLFICHFQYKMHQVIATFHLARRLQKTQQVYFWGFIYFTSLKLHNSALTHHGCQYYFVPYKLYESLTVL